MPYATITDLQQRYGPTELMQLSDIATPRTGAIVEAVLNGALADASAWIDSFLVGRYPLPIIDATALQRLRLDCCAEARYLLMNARADEAVVLAHTERERFYRSIAKGDISLIPAANVPVQAGAGPVVFNPGAKVFGRDSDFGESDERCARSW